MKSKSKVKASKKDPKFFFNKKWEHMSLKEKQHTGIIFVVMCFLILIAVKFPVLALSVYVFLAALKHFTDIKFGWRFFFGFLFGLFVWFLHLFYLGVL